MNLVTLASGILASMLHVADTPGTQGAVDYAEFSVSRLRCVIGNNMAVGEHQAGYNGVLSLYAPNLDESPFVPAYAGLNIEHYFDGRLPREERAIFFEPRVAPMTFTRINDATCELHQPATAHYGVESWTRFELKEPYYVDITFRCIPRKPGLEGGWFGVFWASYINAPLDKSIYFLAARSSLDKPLWTQYCTQEHARDSTVCHESDQWSIPFAGGAGSLLSSISPLRYSASFFYGRFRDRVLIYIFEPNPHIRFSHSPSGGGLNAEKGTHNPAWDFQLLIPDYQVNTEYRLTMRLVYKPWVDRADVIAEVRKCLGSR